MEYGGAGPRWPAELEQQRARLDRTSAWHGGEDAYPPAWRERY